MHMYVYSSSYITAPAQDPSQMTGASSSSSASSHHGPHSVYVVLWRDASSGDFLALGAFETLADANAEVRRRGSEQLSDGLTHSNSEADAGGIDAEPLRWDTADGVACWVEQHRVNPGTTGKA